MNDFSRGSPAKLAFPLLDLPLADTVVYLYPSPSPSPPLRVSSQKLLAANSEVFRKLLGPTEQFRILRRMKLLKDGLPFGIRFVIDLSPPTLEEDAVELVEELWCPDEVLRWRSNIEGEYFEEDAIVEEKPQELSEDPSQPSKSLACVRKGITESDSANDQGSGSDSNSGDSQASRQHILPPAYSPARHTAAIERILSILHDIPIQISSSAMWYTVYKASVLLNVESKVADYLTSWLYGNIPFIQTYPSIVLNIAEKIKSATLYRDAFALLMYKQVYWENDIGIEAQGDSKEHQWGKNISFAKMALRQRLLGTYSNITSLGFLRNEVFVPEYQKLAKIMSSEDSDMDLVAATGEFQEMIAKILEARLSTIGHTYTYRGGDGFYNIETQARIMGLQAIPKEKWPYIKSYWEGLRLTMAEIDYLPASSVHLMANALACKRKWEIAYEKAEQKRTQAATGVGEEKERLRIVEVRGANPATASNKVTGDRNIVENGYPGSKNYAGPQCPDIQYPELQNARTILRSAAKFQFAPKTTQSSLPSNVTGNTTLPQQTSPPQNSASATNEGSAPASKWKLRYRGKSKQSLSSPVANPPEPGEDLLSTVTIFGLHSRFEDSVEESSSSPKRRCSDEREAISVPYGQGKAQQSNAGSPSSSGPSWIEKGKYKAVKESPVLGAQKWLPQHHELNESTIIPSPAKAESSFFEFANPSWKGFTDYDQQEKIWKDQAKYMAHAPTPANASSSTCRLLSTNSFESYTYSQRSQNELSIQENRQFAKAAPPLFDLEALWNQIQNYISSITSEILTLEPLVSFETEDATMRDFCFGAEEELKYLPIWAGGCDDGSGGVFGEFVEPQREETEEDAEAAETAAMAWGDDETDTATLGWTDAGPDNESGSEVSRRMSLDSDSHEEWSECEYVVKRPKVGKEKGKERVFEGEDTEEAEVDMEWFDDESDSFEEIIWE